MTTPLNTLPLPSKGEAGRGLTRHFTLAEFTRSTTAKRHGLDNRPSNEAIQNLRFLCEHILEPLRQHLGCPITITSGYRQPHVNILVGGVRNSQHILGQAADIRVSRNLMPRAYMYIRDHLPYDQLIMEPGWIHVSYRHGHNRHQEVIIDPNEV